MAAKIPEQYRDLLEKPIVVGLATMLPNGQPQVTPVWADFDGEHIRVNTAAGRQKQKDMAARPQVTVLAIDPSNPYRYLEVRGKVSKISKEVAEIFKSPDMRARLETLGVEPTTSTPEEFAAFTVSEMARWSDLVKEAGATAR